VLTALTVLGVLVLAGCSGTTPPASARSTSAVGQSYQSSDGSVTTWAKQDRGAAISLTGTDFEGAPVDVAAWHGDVVVLNAWYAGCPPCRAEAPGLVKVATDFAHAGVHLLGINGVDDAGTAQAFQRTFSVPYPSIADTGARAVAALQGLVPVQAVPTTVLLDREGRVAARVLGEVDPSTLTALIKDLLAEPGSSPSATGGSSVPASASP
jgi:peroxiredoxin